MVLRTLAEIPDASSANLKEALTWWLTPKLIQDDVPRARLDHRKAMIAALTAELARRVREDVSSSAMRGGDTKISDAHRPLADPDTDPRGN